MFLECFFRRAAKELFSHPPSSSQLADALKGTGGLTDDVLELARKKIQNTAIVKLTEAKSELWTPKVATYKQPRGTRYSQNTTVVLAARDPRHRIKFQDKSLRLSRRNKATYRPDKRLTAQDAPNEEDYALVQFKYCFGFASSVVMLYVSLSVAGPVTYCLLSVV